MALISVYSRVYETLSRNINESFEAPVIVLSEVIIVCGTVSKTNKASISI